MRHLRKCVFSDHLEAGKILAMGKTRTISTSSTGRPHRKTPKPKDACIICVSSRALFDLREGRTIMEDQGLEQYIKHMVDSENTPLAPGPAFAFVQAIEAVNLALLEINPEEKNLFDVVLMSENHAQCGVRYLNSIRHHGLNIERVCLTAGRPVTSYLSAYGTHLYLSTDHEKVKDALKVGVPAATLPPYSKSIEENDELRVAFDGDAVLFSDEAEAVAKREGLFRFFDHETENEDIPLQKGPLIQFAWILGQMQKKFRQVQTECPIRTYLVTARSAASAGSRAMKTLRSWGLDIDEAHFMAGAPKGPLLDKIKPHLFFDDQVDNIKSSTEYGLPAAHVPWGVANESKVSINEGKDTSDTSENPPCAQEKASE